MGTNLFFVAILVSFFIFIVMISISLSEGRRINLVKKAVAQNHILKGKLIKCKSVRRASNAQLRNNNYDLYDLGTYQYEYKGRTYTCKVERQAGHLPNEIDLFYTNNPRKATDEYSLARKNSNWFIYAIIALVIFIIWGLLAGIAWIIQFYEGMPPVV